MVYRHFTGLSFDKNRFRAISLYLKLELHGKMKVDIFQHLCSKLPQKRPLFSILPLTLFNPFSSPLKYEKSKENHKNTHFYNKLIFLITNWGCYSKIDDSKSLGNFMFNKSVTSKFRNTLPFSLISAPSF